MPPTYTVELPDVNYFSRQVLCREGCPVRTDAGGYVQAIAEGRYEDAYLIARAPNPFASICGRVCAAPCEAKCRRGALDAAVPDSLFDQAAGSRRRWRGRPSARPPLSG